MKSPEIYHYAMQEALYGCEGVRNISEDIVFHAKDDKEHDEGPETLLDRLNQRGLNLNREECTFKMY